MNKETLPQPGTEEKPIWKIRDLAAFFDVNQSSVYRWIAEGKIKSEQIHRTPGGSYRFKPSDFQQEEHHA